jgi:hypothetical protein
MRRNQALTLTRPRRAIELAQKSRRIAKLRVVDEVEATRLVRFGRYGRYLGNGLAVIDFGSRVSHVHDIYKARGDWYREMFVESFSFAASAGFGEAVALGGSAIAAEALGALVAATPAGWVLFVVGLGVAAAAAGTSILADKIVKKRGGHWYDSITKWMNSL